MPRFLVLLRGVNVGKSKRVPMAKFRALLIGLGYTSVATLLNSGNAVFSAAEGTPAAHASAIAAAISERLKVDVLVIVKSARQLASIVSENPLRAEAAQHSRFLVAFAQDAKTLSSLVALESLVAPPERFALGRNAAYLLCAADILESKAGAGVLGKAGRSATTRNWATVLKLQGLARSAANARFYDRSLLNDD